MAQNLRITGGEKRGQKLFSPPARSIRPASDMIRQAVFNMLAQDIEGVEFFDVFAGTGIVGIEAISRGARRAVFIEREKRQASLIERNIARVEVRSQSQVRHSDAFLWARHFQPGPDNVIVFLGPPYELFEGEDFERMLELVGIVQEALRSQDILVLQFPKETPADRLPRQEGWYRLKKYGKSQVGLWSAAEPREPEVDVEPGS